MKLAKLMVLILSLVTSFTISAASEQALLRAATRGDVEGIKAALQSGVNINTRFEVGKTALMIAAENKRDAAVEALMDAGADLYVLDNNKWDVLTHAANAPSTPIMKLLLRKGYDPSKVNWRALEVARSKTSVSWGGGWDPIALQAREILEDAYKNRGSGVSGTIGLATMPPPAPTTASANTKDVRNEENAPPVFVNVAEMKLTSDIFKKTATKAMTGRGWTVLTTEPDKLTGTYTKGDKQYRASIFYKHPVIKISYIDGYGSSRDSWLMNLKKDLEYEINMELTR